MVLFFGFGNITHTNASSKSQFNDLKNWVFKHTTLPFVYRNNKHNLIKHKYLRK